MTQRKPQTVATSLPLMGKPVELKSAIGVLLESGEMKRLAWTYQGVEFEMIGKLAEEEMVKIANSTFDQLVK